MSTTPNLAIAHILQAQAQKEVTANAALDALDRAMTDRLALDFAAGDVTLTDDAFRRHFAFASANMAEGRALTVPALRRLFLVDNAAGAHALTVQRGTAAVPVAPGAATLLYADGTADGLAPAAPAAAAQPHDLALFIAGRPEPAERVLTFVAARPFQLPIGLDGSRAHAGVAAGAEAVFDLRRNGSSIGSITFAAAASTATFALASAQSFAPGDRLELIAPASPDADLADIALTLQGTR